METTKEVSWHQNALLDALHGYQQQGVLCDTSLVTPGGHTIMAHSCVLAAVSSKLYDKMLSLEVGPRTLDIGTSPQACQNMLDFIYTGICNLDQQKHQEVLALCEELGIRLGALPVGKSAMTCSSRDCESTESVGADTDEEVSDEMCSNSSVMIEEANDEMCSNNSVLIEIKQLEGDAGSSTGMDTVLETVTLAKKRDHYTKKPVQGPKKKYALFKCRICRLVCHTRSNRNHHEQAEHRGEKPYRCTLCPQTYVKLSEYRVHLRMHTGGRPYRCRFCDRCFPAKAKLDYHENTHTGNRPHKCEICKRSFSTPYALAFHVKRHSSEMPFNCTRCGVFFRNRNAFLRHKRGHVLMDKSGTQMSPYPYGCAFCDKLFGTSAEVAAHERSHTSTTLFPCSFCGKTFTQKSSVRTHEATHTGDRPHKCTECSKTFMRPARLREHMRSHTKEKPFTCEFCGAGFATTGGLSNHKRTVHTKQNLQMCRSCDKTFSKPSLLKIHERKHTEERPFACGLCNKSFPSQSSLTRHRKSHKPLADGVVENNVTGNGVVGGHENTMHHHQPQQQLLEHKQEQTWVVIEQELQ